MVHCSQSFLFLVQPLLSLCGQRMESIGAQQYHTRQHSTASTIDPFLQTYSGPICLSLYNRMARIGTARSTSRPPRPARALRSCARSARRSSRTTQKRISSTCCRTIPSTLCALICHCRSPTLTTQCRLQRCGTLNCSRCFSHSPTLLYIVIHRRHALLRHGAFALLQLRQLRRGGDG